VADLRRGLRGTHLSPDLVHLARSYLSRAQERRRDDPTTALNLALCQLYLSTSPNRFVAHPCMATRALQDLLLVAYLRPDYPGIEEVRAEAARVLAARVCTCCTPTLEDARFVHSCVALRAASRAPDRVSAIALYDESLCHYEQNGESRLARGWRRLEDDPRGAFEDFDEVIRRGPAPKDKRSTLVSRAYAQRAFGWMRQGDLTRALDDFATALQPGPGVVVESHGAYRGQATVLLTMGRHADAVAAIHSARAPQRGGGRPSRDEYRVSMPEGGDRVLWSDLERALARLEYDVAAEGSQSCLTFAARGRAKLLLGQRDTGLADVRYAAVIDLDTPWSALWLAAFTGEHAALDARAPTGWFAELGRACRSEVDDEAAVTVVLAAPGDDDPSERRCVAHCMLGVVAERRSNLDRARRHYVECVRTGQVDCIQFDWAFERLVQMGPP
jgi:hypothetical protein